MSAHNDAVIAEFRSHEGTVGGGFTGVPLLLITSTGARSGRPHTTPVTYRADGDRWLVFASAAGAANHPAWYHNLVAHPEAVIEVGTERVEVTAVVTEGAERDRLFADQVREFPRFAEYQDKTSRVIPVVALERRTG
ncbi:nitroreductase/quinone reductase family protein [Streptacidiphilus sp. P02-A3a]|uniref:nitroreductase/quinone reductase family protein n=1 Tax=Streptacidiphilus sp. P02-A3a TaxID=2704468 RepID=UPI0015FBA202|nr:nitroreductase/quinone reductase family protein [Streptacidiphilus sp. P02-A3a]QMU68304.1 nitroreductase family deazaflavin-dependent oxidoreductase [Streptacidiphilus sp. P02-A3a]